MEEKSKTEKTTTSQSLALAPRLSSDLSTMIYIALTYRRRSNGLLVGLLTVVFASRQEIGIETAKQMEARRDPMLDRVEK